MADFLDKLINQIGICALSYINGKRADKHIKPIEETIFMTMELAELKGFMTQLIENTCGKDNEADITGRRLHLKYMLDVYFYAREKLVTAQQNELEKLVVAQQNEQENSGWSELENVLADFIETFDTLLTQDVSVTFNNTTYQLISLKHQSSLANAFSSLGNLGLKFNDIVIKSLFDSRRPKAYRTVITEEVSALKDKQKTLLLESLLEVIQKMRQKEQQQEREIQQLKQQNAQQAEEIKRLKLSVGNIYEILKPMSAALSTCGIEFGPIKPIVESEPSSVVSQATQKEVLTFLSPF